MKRCDSAPLGQTDGSPQHLVVFHKEKLLRAHQLLTSSVAPQLVSAVWDPGGGKEISKRTEQLTSSPSSTQTCLTGWLTDWLSECVWSEWLSQGRRGWCSSGGGRTGSHSPQRAADSVNGCRGRLADCFFFWFFLKLCPADHLTVFAGRELNRLSNC